MYGPQVLHWIGLLLLTVAGGIAIGLFVGWAQDQLRFKFKMWRVARRKAA